MSLLMGGIFAALRLRIGLTYGLMGLGFAIAFVALELTGNGSGPDGVFERVVFAVLVVGPALILSSLCWNALREHARLAVL